MFRRRWKSRPTRSKSRKRKALIVLLVFALFSLQSFIFIDRNLKPPLMKLAKVRIKQMATEAINMTIANQIAAGDTQFDRLIDWKFDNNGKIASFMLNYGEHMKITTSTIERVHSLLHELKERPDSIPLGQAFDSPILSSFGPKIPVRFTPHGAAKVELGTRYQNAGINMILVEVYVRIIVEMTIIIPFHTEPELVETEVPISYVLVVGDTPAYYFDNRGNPVGENIPPPNISIPNISNPAAREGEAGPAMQVQAPASSNPAEAGSGDGE